VQSTDEAARTLRVSAIRSPSAGPPPRAFPLKGRERPSQSAMLPLMKPFWETKSLAEMSEAEWESLCDGCGRCCLVVLEDDKGRYYETDVACRLFDAGERRCTDYRGRHKRVPDCVRLTAENAGALAWMPESCAYRRLARGQSLPDWHPLITGDPDSVRRAGAAVRADVESEAGVADEELEGRVTGRR